MGRCANFLVIVLTCVWTDVGKGQETGTDEKGSGCLTCHKGIEPIREPESKMMQRIFRKGKRQGDPAGCIVCHGGDPKATTKDEAHKGEFFYSDPGSPWVNDTACGPCHDAQVGAQWNSLMMSESGKIQGTCWSFGGLEGYDHKWGNYDAQLHMALATSHSYCTVRQLRAVAAALRSLSALAATWGRPRPSGA